MHSCAAIALMLSGWAILGCGNARTSGAAATARASAAALADTAPAPFDFMPTVGELRHLTDSLARLDPVQEARLAATGGTPRLLAIGGHSIGFPGLPGDSTRRYRQLYDWLELPYTGSGTWIVNGDSAHVLWQERAAAYARAYNQELVRVLSRGR